LDFGLKHAAIFADKILKGAKAADLPVEQPRKFEFIIDLKAECVGAGGQGHKMTFSIADFRLWRKTNARENLDAIFELSIR
jgi:hypothetical protein